MKYCRKDYIHKDSLDCKDAEVFTVYTDKEWAFAMRINNHFTITKFHPQNAPEETIRKAKKQILFCKNYGWANTGQKSMNLEVDEMEPLFYCMYCHKTTFDIGSPCFCRNKTTEDFLKKTDSGIILPF